MGSVVNDTTRRADAITGPAAPATPAASATPAGPATPFAIARLRGLSRGIGYFWQGITYVFLVLVNAEVFAQRPALLTQPQGWAILALSLLFGAWYYVGFNWVLGANRDAHWQALAVPKLPPGAWRGFLVWAVAFALNLALYTLDHNFMWMLWSVYGVSFSVWPLPYALALFAPTAFAIFATQGWLPTDWQPMSLIWFAVGVGMFCIYTATAYLPFILLRGRFDRERMFADLAASHQALAEAHRQLEVASARDRELAALRERGRIARDMHDTLGHSLALIAVKLDAAQRLRAVDGARADHEIAATQGIARSALAELRASLTELRAAIPEQPPLGEALARVAREAGERAGWRVTYAIAPDLGDQAALDEATYAALLRVGAEALANAERHAHARNVTLTLTRDGCDLALRIEDDGVGVLATNPPLATTTPHMAHTVAVGAPSVADDACARDAIIASPPGHYGVTGMRERMAEVGGRFSIGPAVCDAAGPQVARGTLVEARVPVRGF